MIFTIILFSLFSIAVASVLRGAVVMFLWNWFVATSLSLPVMNLVPAMGIGLLMTYLTTSKRPNVESDSIEEYTSELGKAFGFVLTYSVLVWSIGWVIQLFM